MLVITLGGCRLEFTFSCFALLAFCCLFAGFSGGAFLLSAVLIHELFHLAVLFLFHAPPMCVRVSALGCRMVLNPQKRLNYWKNALVSLAGPAGNLMCFGVMVLLGKGSRFFAAASLSMGVFHCLPIEPLDGGLALRAALSGFLENEKAEKLALVVSLLFLLPLAVLGFLILLRTRYNFSLLAMSVYLMLYLVLGKDGLTD